MRLDFRKYLTEKLSPIFDRPAAKHGHHATAARVFPAKVPEQRGRNPEKKIAMTLFFSLRDIPVIFLLDIIN
jgi:hypothetical protein